MTVVASEFFYNKAKKKILTVEMEEDEELFKSIKEAMKQNNVKECTVETMDGAVKKGVMNYLSGNKYSVQKLDNTTILHASGNFKLSYDELFGSLHVLAKTTKPISGTLAGAIAANGLKIKLMFYEERKIMPEQQTAVMHK